MRDKHQNGFGIVEFIIIVAVIAILGTLGVVAYNSFQKDDEKKDSSTSQSKITKPEAKKPCPDEEGAPAKSGVFCSEGLGVKFTIPSIFKGKLVKGESYEIFEGQKGYYPGQSAGRASVVYTAQISGTDNYKLTIAQEPLRSGYIGFGHALQNTYYDKDAKTLVTESNEEVPSFMVDGVRFYKGQIGDAGMMENAYMAVIKDKIVKIKIHNTGYMGPGEDPAKYEVGTIFSELDNEVKKLKRI